MYKINPSSRKTPSLKVSKFLKVIKMSLSSSTLSLYISAEMERQMLNAATELAHKAIMECGARYNFDGEEAFRSLGLEYVKVERRRPVVEKKPREVVVRPAFPLPYNGEFNEACCLALRQNNGLYTQCQAIRKGDTSFCKACQVLADKNEGMPEYGTIQQRQAVGVFEYVDPKGRKPVHYTKVMKKYKVSPEQVLEEAGKFNINIIAEHLVMIESEKRGRPASKKEKNSEAKAPKGRPKKSKKVLEISGDNEVSDLFAAMVLDASEDSDDESVATAPSKKSEEEKALKEMKKAEEKALKEAQRLKEKAEKEVKLAAEKAEKEAKKEAERLEREAKKSALELEKAAKEAQRLKEKEEKEAKKKAAEEKKAAKEAKKPASKKEVAAAAPQAEEEEEGDRVDTVKIDGKKYLVSAKTGIVYDYSEWKQKQEQVVLGKYNKETQKIIFKAAESESDDSEEEEEDYEEEA